MKFTIFKTHDFVGFFINDMKTFFLTLFFCLLLLNTNKCHSQNNNTQATIYNVGLGSFFGGVGAVINKKPDEKFGKVFLKGVLQGSLGGYITYQSKKMVYEFSNSGDFKDAWAAKLLNSAGNSIIHNAASNRNFWEQWNLNIGFNRIEFHTKDKFKVRYKLMPAAFMGTMITATQGDFDIETSLKIGQFVFRTDFIESTILENPNGKVSINTMLLKYEYFNRIDEAKTIAHEIIHIFQYEDFANINPFFIKPRQNFINNDNKWVKFYNKWVYTDFNSFIDAAIYSYENSTGTDYYDNYLEKEADFYSNRTTQ